ANTADTLPSLKKKIAGIKYTKLGIVCIASSIGRIIPENILLKAIHIPNGIPINNEIKTDVIIIAIVVIISSHRLNDPIRKIKAPKTIPQIKDLKYQPKATIIITNTHQGKNIKASSIALIVIVATLNMKSNNGAQAIERFLTKSSTYCPTFIVHSSGNTLIICTAKCSFHILL